VQPVRRGRPARHEEKAEHDLHDHRCLGRSEQRPEHDRGARVIARPADRTPRRGDKVGREHGDADSRVRYVQGALVLFSRRALALGVRFNEDLFMYLDEIDLGWTLREKGLAAYVDRRVRYRHRNEPLSLGVAAGYLQQRNRAFLARKHLSGPKLLGFLIYSTLLEVPLKAIVRSLQGHPRFGMACVLGHWDGLRGRMGKGRIEKLGRAR
jgi:GT2 family glycosyltransferase